ncbi:MAG: FKBP-type peptidyl-prolyl cis-trans isomerase [Saprospiraceae bacterium]
MRNLSFSMLLCATLFFSACGEKNITPNGYKFTVHHTSNGQKPAPGDMAFVHIYGYVDGKFQNSTRQNDRVLPVRVNSKEELQTIKDKGTPNPIYDAVSVMSVGDSISIFIPVTEEMKKNPQMANAKEMRYDIVMLESKTQEDYQAEQKADKERREEEGKILKARESEVATVVTDLAAQYRSGKLKDQLTTTESGLKYMILEPGNGPTTQNGQKVTVNYYGTLTDGTMFDNSFKSGQPFSFNLGQGRVIKGWDEGVALLKGGDQAVFFIPSELGYGKTGSGARIPGDSELIFYIEVL